MNQNDFLNKSLVGRFDQTLSSQAVKLTANDSFMIGFMAGHICQVLFKDKHRSSEAGVVEVDRLTREFVEDAVREFATTAHNNKVGPEKINWGNVEKVNYLNQQFPSDVQSVELKVQEEIKR